MSETIHPVIEPYERPTIACRPYDPRCADVARQIVAFVRAQLPHVRAEHVGSSAVPGCAGESVVDVMVTCPAANLDAVVQNLEKLGFQTPSALTSFPEDRLVRVGAIAYVGDQFPVHLHVLPEESADVDRTRLFLAALRGDPELLKAYVKQKRAIVAAGVSDYLAYSTKKVEFIRAVLG